jgi:hypothetical protein
LTDNLSHHFSQQLPGVIWKIVDDPRRAILYLEVRDVARKKVSFSAFHLGKKEWLFENQVFDEDWWISLVTAVSGRLVFTLYTDTQNPDKKSVIVFNIETKTIDWWKSNFALSFAEEKWLSGVDTKFGSKEVVLDLFTGFPVARDTLFVPGQNFDVIRPFQYTEGSEHFETVKSFLIARTDILPRFSVEYCEHAELIFVSAFTGEKELANYLLVFNSDGKTMLKETLGEDLKGIATDTFFLFKGFLIFVKNKSELVSYKLYD